MMMRTNVAGRMASRWLRGVSAVALTTAAVMMAAPAEAIVVRDDVGRINARDINNLWPAVGQIVTWFPGGGVGLCTGTYINPRVVIAAAHCFADTAGDEELLAGNGLVVSFTTRNFALPHLQQFLRGRFQTTETVVRATDIVVHEDYLAFPRADVAFMALDTPRLGPTLSLMLSPVAEGTTATIVGYGRNGIGSLGDVFGIDWWRRVAQNTISLDSSFDDLLGADVGQPYAWYWSDFDQPGNPANDFWEDGGPLPNEGTTAPGDSGGPLIVNMGGRNLVAGVLSGGFAVGTVNNGWGDVSFWQALYDYAQWLAVNNPYKYVGARAGDGLWTDPQHWVQMLDPAYMMTTRNAQGQTVLVNMLPAFDTSSPLSGPGSTGFVPNNTDGAPSGNVTVAGAPARYFDVTLANAGTTTLNTAVEIDRLTVSGSGAVLNITGAQSSLTSLLDVSMVAGRVNVGGVLSTDMFAMAGGALTGTGTVNVGVLMAAGGMVAPGTMGGVGTLTVNGDVGFVENGTLAIDMASGASADRLTVSGLMLADGVLAAMPTSSYMPVFGHAWTVASAAGGVQGQFTVPDTLAGILFPRLEYTGNTVRLVLDAADFADVIGPQTGAAASFADALDSARSGSYSALGSLFQTLDLVPVAQVGEALASLNPDEAYFSRRGLRAQAGVVGSVLSNRMTAARAGETGLTLAGLAPSLYADRRDGSLLTAFAADEMAEVQEAVEAMEMKEGWSLYLDYRMTEGDLGNSPTGLEGEIESDAVTVGVDHVTAGGMLYGAAASYAWGEAEAGMETRESETESMTLSGYLSWTGDMGFIDAYATVGQVDVETSRLTLGQVIEGETDGFLIGAGLRFGSELSLGRNAGLIPEIRADLSSIDLDGYDETGGTAALSIPSETLTALQLGFGATLWVEHRFTETLTVRPTFTGRFVAEASGDTDAVVNTDFVAAPGVVIPDLPEISPDKEWAEFGAGLNFLVNDTTQVMLNWEMTAGRKDLDTDTYRATVRLRF